MGRLYEAGGGAGGLVDEGLPCRAGCRQRFWRLVAMVAMMASMRWASAAAAGACTAVLAASGWACGWQSGFGLGGWVGAGRAGFGVGFGVSGALSHAQAAGRPGLAAAPRARGDLRAELVMLARYLLEKGECKNAEGGDRSFWRQNLASGRESSSWFGGDPVEKIPKVPKGSEVQSFQSSVHSGTCRHLAGDRRVEAAAAGVGRCWHRRAEGR